jgi:hypothetical protein
MAHANTSEIPAHIPAELIRRFDLVNHPGVLADPWAAIDRLREDAQAQPDRVRREEQTVRCAAAAAAARVGRAPNPLCTRLPTAYALGMSEMADVRQ